MIFFDAQTIDEAYVTQYDLEQRGQLQHARGKHPSEEAIQLMRVRTRIK